MASSPLASVTLLAFLLLLLLLGLEPATCRSGKRATPRALHEPFHIDPPPAPAPAPAAPPASEPGTPVSSPPVESSSNTPFFPLPPYYSPPAPPGQTSSTAGGGTTGLPANVNGGGAQPATKAASGDNNGGHHGSGKIVIAIIVCLCIIAFLGGLLFCLNRHRVRYSAHGSANWDTSAAGAKFSDETPLASSATTPAAHAHAHAHGNGKVLSPAKVVALNAGSAELLYLGTFGNRNSANSHVVEEQPKPENEANPNPNGNAAPFPASPPSPRFGPARRQRFPDAEPRTQRQLSRELSSSSPEIHPLPPLSKKPRPTAAAAAVAAVSAQSAPSASTDSSDEESFYSPRANSSSSGSPRTCKKRLFSPAPAPAPAQKSRLSFSSSESPSSSSSASSTSSPAPSSPSLDSPPAAPITPMRAHPHSQNCSSSDAPRRQQQQQQQSPALAPAKKPPPPPPPPPPPFRPPTVLETNPAKVKPQSKGRTDPALQTDLPRLPVRPPPRFLSQSRSGKHSPSGSSVSPAVEIPLPPPPSSRTGLFSARTGQPIQHLRPISENSVENSADSAAGSDQTPKPKLKPLHWDKVRASPEKAMVWDQLKSGSFQLNEEMIETLFVYNTPHAAKTDLAKRSAANSPASLNQRLLDPKKSQNIAILLRALNVTKEEVCEALVDGTYDSIGIELLETLSKMAPSRDEELRLKEYNGDISKIGVSERFLKALLEIPFAFKRVDAMIYKANFEEEFVSIKKSLQTLEAACEELRSSRLFLKLLEAVLKTGNRMNVGTARGDAQAFKLDTLLKLVDVKGTDGKTTLLHFVVQEIIKAEGARVVATTVSENNAQDQTQKDMDDDEHKKLGLQVVAGLSTELRNVKQAAAMDSEALSGSVSNLARGLGKLKENLQIMMKPQQQQQESVEIQGNFFRSMSLFVEKAENDIRQIQEAEKKAFIRLRETTEYFHGDAAKEEARPLRFFMVVRDFLGILDQVCIEIGRTQIKNKHRFSPSGPPPVIAHPISMPVFARAYERRYDSSEDESSSP